jgi:putative transcriptional regulator
MAKSRILQEVHETARGLHAAGVFSDTTMRDFDKVCLSPVHALAPEDIRKLRKRARVSQAVFAAYLNTTGFRQPFQKMDMRAAREPRLVREVWL